MASATEAAARTYAAAWQEPDPDHRARMIEDCFAVDGRIVTSGDGIRGRAELAAAISELRADPRGLAVKLLEPIDVQGRKFRLHSIVEQRDGSATRFFDAGEVDADGRITTLITFREPPG